MRKLKLLIPSKSLAITENYVLNSIVISTISAKGFILKYEVSLPGPHLKTIGICYYAIVLKEKKKKHKTDHSKNVFKNSYFPTNKTAEKINQWKIIEIDMFLWNTGNWDLSTMKVSYNLTKRKTNTEKFENKIKNGYHKHENYSLSNECFG